MKTLQNKIAIITGASRGLGAQAAKTLGAHGAFVVVNYHGSEDAAKEVVDEISKKGGESIAIQGDISNSDGIDDFFEAVDAALKNRFGETHFDILVNNAGINHAGTFEDTTEEDFDRLFDLNVKGSFFVTQKASPRLRDGGRVVMLSTGLTRFSMPQYSAYSATKGAIDVLTQNLALVLGNRGITVNAVAPGATDTDMNAGWLRDEDAQNHISSVTALGRVGQPEDIADVIGFIASGASRWVTGQRIEASGGMNL